MDEITYFENHVSKKAASLVLKITSAKEIKRQQVKQIEAVYQDAERRIREAKEKCKMRRLKREQASKRQNDFP